MRKAVKIWLITAAALILIGCIIFGSVMIIQGWDFMKLSTNKYETNNYEISEGFGNISIKTDTASILFAPSEDEKCRVVCFEEKNVKHSVSVQDGTLTINAVNEKKWYEYIGINFGSPKITVYLPQSEYTSLVINESTGDVEIPKEIKFESIDVSASTGDVKCYASASESIKIKTSTGYVIVEDISAGVLDVSVTTGNVTASGVACEGDVKVGVSTGRTELNGISCKSFISTGDTGDISLKSVIAAEKLSIERSTGDVSFDGCDAAEISVLTDTGDVEGSLLTEKIFIVNTDTGRKEVPESTTGGKCKITTDTGDIKINIKR